MVTLPDSSEYTNGISLDKPAVVRKDIDSMEDYLPSCPVRSPLIFVSDSDWLE